jgi:hypothetical protein
MGVGDRFVWSVLKAGAVYFTIVFAVGFLLGTVRVLVLVPRVGETAAVMIELPIILAASWITCRWLIARFSVPARPMARPLSTNRVTVMWLKATALQRRLCRSGLAVT